MKKTNEIFGQIHTHTHINVFSNHIYLPLYMATKNILKEETSL